MDYKVVVTAEAEEDLNQFIQYLLFAKKNEQAAKNLLLTTVKHALSIMKNLHRNRILLWLISGGRNYHKPECGEAMEI